MSAPLFDKPPVKSATLYVVDVSESMGKRHNGRVQDDLTWAMDWVKNDYVEYLLSTLKSNRYGFMTVRTGDDHRSFEIVSELDRAREPSLETLNEVCDAIRPSNGDGVSLITYLEEAVNVMEASLDGKKFGPVVNLITNATAPADWDAHADKPQKIAKWFRRAHYKLNVFLIDSERLGSEDGSDGSVEGDTEEEASNRAANVANFVKLQKLVGPNMAVRPYSAVNEQMRRQWVKQSDGRPSKESLPFSLGLPGSDVCFEFACKQIPCIRPQSKRGKTDTVMKKDDRLPSVEVSRKHRIFEQDVEPDDWEDFEGETKPAYAFGETWVPIQDHEELKELLTETMADEPRVEVLGFLKKEEFKPWLITGSKTSTDYLIASEEEDQLKMTVLLNVMLEAGFYALVRMVTKSSSRSPHEPPVKERMSVLFPYGKNGVATFISCRLPYREDMRYHQFPSLETPKNSRGAPLPSSSEEYKNIVPSSKMDRLWGDVIDSMMLAPYPPKLNEDQALEREFELFTDPDADQGEFNTLKINEPTRARYSQAIKACVLSGSTQLPEPYPEFLEFSAPPNELTVKSKDARGALKTELDIQKVPPRKARENKAEASGLPPASNFTHDDMLALMEGKEAHDSTTDSSMTAAAAGAGAGAAAGASQDMPSSSQRRRGDDARDVDLPPNVPRKVSVESPVEDFSKMMEALDKLGASEHQLMRTCIDFLRTVGFDKALAVGEDEVFPLEQWSGYISDYKDITEKYDVEQAPAALTQMLEERDKQTGDYRFPARLRKRAKKIYK